MKDFEADSSTDFKLRKRNILIVGIAFAIVSSVISIWLENNRQIEGVISLLTAIGYGILILLWCRVDSDARNENLGSRFCILVVIFGIFALIYYLFKSRGFRQGFLSVGYMLLYFIVAILISAVISTLLGILLGR